jgi:inner membrane protein
MGARVASGFGHMAVAYAMGKTLKPAWSSTRFWMLTALCCVLPDVDVLGLLMGIPYDHILGHRGVTHSVVFAIMVGIVMPRVLTSGFSCCTYRYGILAVYFSLVTLSHGALDAFTDGGLGIAFFAPFDATRYFFPWRPIAVSPIGISQFFSHWGLSVLLTEAIWIGISVCFWLGILQVVRRKG